MTLALPVRRVCCCKSNVSPRLARWRTPAHQWSPWRRSRSKRTACLVIHVSGLAAHTRNLRNTPAVSLMVMRAEVAGDPVHALPRVTVGGRAELLDIANPIGQVCRAAYLARFPATGRLLPHELALFPGSGELL